MWAPCIKIVIIIIIIIIIIIATCLNIFWKQNLQMLHFLWHDSSYELVT